MDWLDYKARDRLSSLCHHEYFAEDNRVGVIRKKMSTELIISITGAASAILVAVIGSILTRRSSLAIQSQKLKEDYYLAYIEAIHLLSSNNTRPEYLDAYTASRNRLLVVASVETINAILLFEKEAMGVFNPQHNELLTNVLKAIRNGLNLSNKSYPTIELVKG